MTAPVSSSTINAPDWAALARRGAWQKTLGMTVMIAFMVVITLPILMAYIWMLLIAMTARGDTIGSTAFWHVCAVLFPAALAATALVVATAPSRQRKMQLWGICAVALGGITYVLMDDFNPANFKFLFVQEIMSLLPGRPNSGQNSIPSVWEAFGNSLLLAGSQTVIVVGVATMAGYYLSRFNFTGRSVFLQSLLVLQAFPAITLTIPLFVIVFNIGLLNTITGPMLVLTTLELPFFIFIMKGFFDAVPWDIERSALTDGATRRQAFFMVVLPQVTGGMIAVAVFAFIKGWEEYVFVSALRTGEGPWVMSTYLYFVAQDTMGVDYGLVAAVSVFYVIPSLVLYVFCQKYLTQMSVGGVKG